MQDIDQAIVAVVAQATGRPGTIDSRRAVGGGCINQTYVYQFADRRRFFVKVNAEPLVGMFEREAEGLNALAQAKTIRVPQPLGVSPANVTPFLVMEYIEAGRPGRDFSQRFGHEFALLHQTTQRSQFGFGADNYIGSTRQPNCWSDDWISFWREKRLGYQVELARSQGLCDGEFLRLAEQLLNRLPEWLSTPEEPACLLHGDLWGGNYLCDESGAPVLIDPAVYYGRREADLAMTYLFGGFDPEFYAAYEETWPLAPASAERIEIYKLYHLLNHLNLFGSSYRSGCLAILRRFA